jgi:hypothetical protein
VRTFSTSIKGARSAPCAWWRVIPYEAAHTQRPSRRQPRLAGRTQVPAGISRHRAGRFRLCTCGTRRAAARALPRHGPSPAVSPSRTPTVPARERPSSRRSSLEPGKITVKGAFGPRPPRRLLRKRRPWTVIFPGSFWRLSGGWPGAEGSFQALLAGSRPARA